MKGWFVSERLLKNFNCQEDRDLVMAEGETIMHNMEHDTEPRELEESEEENPNDIKDFDTASDKGMAVMITITKKKIDR